jgi:hypothetical protein
MQQYFNNVTNKNGGAISGAFVTVRDEDGNLATIYSDDGVTTQSNPVSTDAKGEFSFYADDGTYTITVTGARIGTSTKTISLTSNDFLQLGTGAVTRTKQDKMRERVSVKDFGAAGDWNGTTGTDDTTAFTACRSYCRTNNKAMYIPAGSYRLTASLSLGTDAGGFPYSGFDFEGDGAECTELVLDYDGANGLDINPGTGGYTAFANSSIGGFRITVPTGRVVNVPLYVKNSYNDRIHDIHVYVPASCADASFIGVRVSGACYFNKFENIWVENHTGTANAASKAFYIGNGLADVGVSGANTSVNTFINCRAYGFGVNWDTIYANSTTFVNCDSETAITRNWRDLSTIGSQYINCWEEGGPSTSATFDRSSAVFQADGSTITGSASDQVLIKGGLWDDIEVDYAYHVRILAAFNNLTVGTNAEDVEADNLKDAGTLTGASNDVRYRQRKTSPVIRNVTNIGSRRVGWQFGGTTGPAELLLNYSSDDLQLSAYRTDGSSAFRGWKQATDATGGWALYSWFTGAAIGSESPTQLMRANISAVSFYVAIFPSADNAKDIGEPATRFANVYANKIRPGAGTVIWTADAGTPEGSVTAPVGSLYTRTDGGAGTTLYVKESGSGNTGWVAK